MTATASPARLLLPLLDEGGASPRDTAERVAGLPPGDVLPLAMEERVEGPLLNGLIRAGAAGGAVVSGLRDIAFDRTVHHVECLQALELCKRVLEDAGIPWIAYKGPVLANLYGAVGPRSYTDIDLLVPAEQLEAAVDALGAAGGRLLDRNWNMVRRELRGEVHVALPSGIVIDLHWHLVNKPEVRRGTRIASDELFDRARPVRVGDIEVQTLAADHQLALLALHAALSGGHRLVWLKDIDRAVVNDPPDWDGFVRTGRAWRTHLALATMIGRTAHNLSTPVPPHVVRELAPGPAERALVRSLRVWTRSGRLPGGGSTGRAVTRALRGDLVSTGRAVGVAAAKMLQRQVDRHPYWSDPEDPRHLLYPTGGVDGRRAFFAAVRATDRFGN